MKNRDWKNWAKCAGIRAIKTVAQTAVATIGVSAVMSDVNCSRFSFSTSWHSINSNKRSWTT